jgi:hypothetical protein
VLVGEEHQQGREDFFVNDTALEGYGIFKKTFAQ